ncbi:xanthine dehydrogenase family protein molybdopterin-binding subunit [Mycobacterium sp. KBS0706]|uniref:xanthine dehydrogenase family protein molybdopterin-binding subunit n=1 Tax=Mycobacterium sp. KBS0706 TaxID=2578109 RepID=UPI00110FC9ED|nr:xanthine dehydrogenase family protein molybdopterin-binding subunit [Mycobacterium sp. KBS0706]TSD90223.1 xanthine dehydrogenase family protein molybdopterin-binding subunit [Mycobacterium sp. KBS0706]
MDMKVSASEASSVDSRLSRRHFLRAGVAAGGGLLISINAPMFPAAAADASAATFAPGAFIRIDTAGQVTAIIPQVEIGQGVYTSMPMLLAEELEVEPGQIRVEHAPPDDKLYANPKLGFQATGGSTSIAAFYEPFRQAGAVARTMLVAAAAEIWGVDASGCRAGNGTVIHDASGRSLGYGDLAAKAATLPVPETVGLKDPKDFRVIGRSLKRRDSVDKTTGRAQYSIDFMLPGMKIAVAQASPVIGGRLGGMDEAAALSVSGVRKVVRFDETVAVIADHTGAARKGLAALNPQWDGGAAAYSSSDLVGELDKAIAGTAVVATNEGDVKGAHSVAARTLDARYEAPLLAHATMEPMTCAVRITADGCDVWVGTQVIARVQSAVAEAIGRPVETVRVHNFLMGGAFGRRLETDYAVQAAKIARQVDFPVKVIWTREEDFQHDAFRPHYVDTLSAALDANGIPTAFSHRVAGSSVMARWTPAWFVNGLDPDAVDGAAGPYRFPNQLIEYSRSEPPAGLMTGWWRGVGVTHNAFVVESFIDEMAEAVGKDPVEFRRLLLAESPRAKAVLDLAAEKAGWGTPMPAGKGRGVSVILLFGTYVAEVAEVSVDDQGDVRLDRVVCAVDCGRVVNPDGAKAQIEGGIIFGASAALYNAIDIDKGRIVQTNFDTYRVMRIDEAPTIEVHFVENDQPPTGTGEPGTAAIAGAIGNAIFAATGKRLRKLPVGTGAINA